MITGTIKKKMSFLHELSLIEKAKIAYGYFILSRKNKLRILGLEIAHQPNLREYYFMIFKEVFLDHSYRFTDASHRKLSELERDCEESGGAVILDIGANIGIATAYLHTAYPKTKIISIEASPINFRYLKQNVESNKFGNVEILNRFVSSIDGYSSFSHNNKKPGGSFGPGFKKSDSNSIVEFEVENVNVTQMVRGFEYIFIKMDVEGAEYSILNHLASSEIVSKILEIIVEVSTYNLACFNALNKVINEFMDLGFSPRIISNYSASARRSRSVQGHLLLLLYRDC